MNYLKTDFDFTEKTKSLIIKKFEHFFTEKFEHDAEYSTLKHVSEITPIGRELRTFLSKYNIDFKYSGINAFISNTTKRTKTNPHVDVLHRDKNFLPIKSRFNVMILGNPNDPMMWWQNFTFGNPDHVKQKFLYYGLEYESLGVLGNSISERMSYLGSPSCYKSNLLTPSAFVDTFCAHALEISKGPRLIISVGIDKHINEIGE